MKNAADTVIDYLAGYLRGEPPGVPFRTLIACIGEIEDNMEIWEATGLNVEGYGEVLSRVKNQIRLSFTADFSESVDSSTGVLDRSDLTVMRWISEKLSGTSLTVPVESIDKITELIDKASEAVREDDSLPEPLRLFIIRVIRETRAALDEYDITGDFDLTEAIVRLTGAVTLATNQSKKPGIWENFREKYLFPVAVGITVTIPSSALEIAKMLAISP